MMIECRKHGLRYSIGLPGYCPGCKAALSLRVAEQYDSAAERLELLAQTTPRPARAIDLRIEAGERRADARELRRQAQVMEGELAMALRARPSEPCPCDDAHAVRTQHEQQEDDAVARRFGNRHTERGG